MEDHQRPQPYFRPTPQGGGSNPLSMRTHIALALAGGFGLAAQAQTLSNVVVTPANPTECQLLTFTFIGSMPQNASFDGFVPDFDADSLNVALSASGGGGGNAPFSQALPGVGPFAPGTYTVYVTFTLNGNLVGTDSQVITIAPGTNPNAGEYGELSNACSGGPAIPLISLLNGDPDPGGAWQDPNGQLVTNGLFVPGQSPEGFYTYFFDVLEPCIDASQIVFITYDPNSADAGLNSEVETCEGYGAPIDLFSSLGGTPDAGGTWTFNGSPHSATYDPVTDECGIYTYTVPGNGGCPPAVATVNMDCVNPPNAGNVSASNDTINRCYNDTIELMQTLVTGEANTGIWIGPSGFGVGLYNDSINLALNGSGVYSYIVTSLLCPTDSSHIYVMLWGDSIQGCTIGMEETEGPITRFDLMPNPAQDQVTIEVALERVEQELWLEILDVDGKMIRRQRVGTNGLFVRQTVPVGDLAKGAYLMRLRSPNGEAVRRLMVK